TASQVPAVSWFLWRPALYLYLLLGGVVIASLRRGSPRYLLVALPVALDSLGMLFLTLAQQLRYQYGTYLVGLVVGLLLYAVRADGREPCTSRRFLVRAANAAILDPPRAAGRPDQRPPRRSSRGPRPSHPALHRR